MVSVDSLEYKFFQETIETTKDLVLKMNLRADLRVPIQQPKTNSGKNCDHFEKIIFLIGEQHAGASYRNISFAHSNRTITELVLRLIDHPKLKIENFFKEGLSEIKYHPELSNISKEDFIIHDTHPLVTALHLSQNQIKIFNCEAKDLFIEFALLSLLHCSLPKVSKIPQQEISRIKNLINCYDENLEISTIIDCKIKQLESELNLSKLKQEKLLKNISINKMSFYLFDNLQKSDQSCENFKYLIQSKLKHALFKRDQAIAQSLIKSQKQFSALIIGDLHLKNLRLIIENQKIPVISISTFV